MKYFNQHFGRYLLLLPVFILAITSALPVAASEVNVPVNQELPQPERPIHNAVDQVDVKVTRADLKGLAVEYNFPQAQLWSVQEEKVDYLQMAIPGMEQAYGELGKPAVPYYSRLLALPQGASVKVNALTMGKSSTVKGKLYPVQEEAHDSRQAQEDEEFPEAYEDPPFVINNEFYSSKAIYPEQTVVVEPIGKMGSLALARVSVATAQYDTAAEELTIFQGASIELTFEGGEEYFLPERAVSTFNQPQSAIFDLLLNGSIIEQFLGILFPQPSCTGHEFLIITPLALRDAAIDLADAKNARGLTTTVATVGNAPNHIGTTTTEIKHYIQTLYDQNCDIQLQYVLLMGDAEHIPPWYNRTYGSDTPGSDLEYALLDGLTIGPITIDDILPDVAIGRIPVDTLAQADQVVGKIIAYEQTPPTTRSFYRNATLASYFQCCRPQVPLDGVTSRSFVETAELIYDELTDSGHDVNRIYTTNDNYHDNPNKPDRFYDASIRDTTPRRYYNQAPLPSAIGPASGFAWNGNSGDIIDAINDGSFLVIHRDHGFKNGWGSPRFTTSNHSALTNGNLTPVVYSVNCASGLFDNETRDPNADSYNYNTSPTGVYWAEDLLRRNGGAIAIIGDTRNSPTWANSALLRGLVDATWPDTVPEGGTNRIRRMGDILNYGKLYLWGQVGVSGTTPNVSNASAQGDILMYHLFGDPTMRMRTRQPLRFGRLLGFRRFLKRTTTLSHATDGATITAIQGDRAVARGVVQNGTATLNFINDPMPDMPVIYIAEHPDEVATTLAFRQTDTIVTPKNGGAFACADGNLKIDIPPQAVAVDTTLRMSWTSTQTVAARPANHVALQSFSLMDVNAPGRNVTDPTAATVTGVTALAEPFQFDLCATEEERKDLDKAFLAYFDEEEKRWIPIEADLDKESGCYRAKADLLSEYAILRDESLSFGDEDTNIYLPFVAR